MAKFIGRRTQIGIGEQFASANGVASDYGLKFSELKLDEVINSSKDTDATGIVDEIANSDVMEKWVEGTLKGIVRTKSFGKVLKAHFGQVTTTDPTDSLYTHTYTRLNSNDYTKYSILEVNPNSSLRYVGCQIGTLNIDWITGDYLRFQANINGKVSEAHGHSITYATEYSFRPTDASIKIASDSSSLSGATAFSVKEIHLALEKELLKDFVIGSADVNNVYNLTYKVTGSIVLNHDGEDYTEYLKTPTKKAMGIYLTRSDVTIGSSSHPYLEFIISQLAFDKVDKKRDLNGIQTITANFTAEYNLTDSRTIQVVYKNDVANYNVVATS